MTEVYTFLENQVLIFEIIQQNHLKLCTLRYFVKHNIIQYIHQNKLIYRTISDFLIF